eukprot:5481149-Amphidinium_carterae.1
MTTRAHGLRFLEHRKAEQLLNSHQHKSHLQCTGWRWKCSELVQLFGGLHTSFDNDWLYDFRRYKPSETYDWKLDSNDSRCTGSRTSAQCSVTCASGYTGTAADSCPSAGGTHSLTG